MAWTFTRPRPTQGLASAALVAGGIGVMALPGVEPAWAGVVREIPEWLLIVVAPMVLHHLMFWGMALFFHRVDRTDKPAWIARRRIQDGPPRRPPLRRTLVNLAWNQLFWAPIMMLLIWVALRARGWAPQEALPGPVEVVVQLLLMGV